MTQRIAACTLGALTATVMCLLVVGCSAEGWPRSYECMRTSKQVTIDGRPDEPAWQNAVWSDDFLDIEGSHKPSPLYRTRMKMLWDERNLYIAADLEEPHVWATLKRHDEIVFHDNDFEVFIDPNGDQRNYFEIEFNALNTVFDLLLVRTYIEQGPALHDWNCEGLQSAVHVNGTLNDPGDTDAGWSVEMAIPWAAMGGKAGVNLPPQCGDEWRMNFSRVEWRHEIVDGRYRRVPNTKEDNWVWSPQGVVNMHVPDRWGYVRFVSRVSSRAVLDPASNAHTMRSVDRIRGTNAPGRPTTISERAD